MASKTSGVGRSTTAPDETTAKESRPRKPRPTVWEQTGGAVGLFISSFPVTVFSLVNTRYGLIPGISSALGTAVAFGILRFLRKQTIRPAVSAFIGISISSSVAFATGTAKGYFLFDIWFYLACLTITLITLAIRRPLAGLLWSSMNRSGGLWRKDKASLFGYDIATVAWAMVFGARFVVQHWLYDRNLTGWLAFAKIMMGFPLTIAAFTAVVWAVRRSEKRLRILDEEAATAEDAVENAVEAAAAIESAGAVDPTPAGEAEPERAAAEGESEPDAGAGRDAGARTESGRDGRAAAEDKARAGGEAEAGKPAAGQESEEAVAEPGAGQEAEPEAEAEPVTGKGPEDVRKPEPEPEPEPASALDVSADPGRETDPEPDAASGSARKRWGKGRRPAPSRETHVLNPASAPGEGG